MKLTEPGFHRACAFVREAARPLDRALLSYHFGDGSADDVLNQLMTCQNGDGGFGRGLEPDFRLEASSPMATSVAAEYILALDVPEEHPLVGESIAYLERTYDQEDGYWPATFDDVNDAPHALWWHVEEVTPPDEADWANPNAELLGYLWRYSDVASKDFLESVTGRARENVATIDTVGTEPYRRYPVLSWERARPHLAHDLATDVEEVLRRTVP